MAGGTSHSFLPAEARVIGRRQTMSCGQGTHSEVAFNNALEAPFGTRHPSNHVIGKPNVRPGERPPTPNGARPRPDPAVRTVRVSLGRITLLEQGWFYVTATVFWAVPDPDPLIEAQVPDAAVHLQPPKETELR